MALSTTPVGATAYIHDPREPDAIFEHPELRATLDLSRPVALVLVAGCTSSARRRPVRLCGENDSCAAVRQLFRRHARTTDFMPAVYSDTIVCWRQAGKRAEQTPPDERPSAADTMPYGAVARIP